MMVYGYSDDATGFVAFAIGDGRVVRTEKTRSGSAMIATPVGAAIHARRSPKTPTWTLALSTGWWAP